jgi:hypothetical protein
MKYNHLDRNAFRAHFSGRHTPGLTQGSPRNFYIKGAVNPGLNPGFGVLRFGLSVHCTVEYTQTSEVV